MSWIKVTRILDRDATIDGLSRVCKEWQEAANGKPLVEVQGSVGLILDDVANAIGLLPEEVAKVLGKEAIINPAQMRLKV